MRVFCFPSPCQIFWLVWRKICSHTCRGVFKLWSLGLPGWRVLELRDFQGYWRSAAVSYCALIYFITVTYIIFEPMWTPVYFGEIFMALAKKKGAFVYSTMHSLVLLLLISFLYIWDCSSSWLFFYILCSQLLCHSHAFLLSPSPTLPFLK